MVIAVIGGGASGMAAAIAAGEQDQAQVVLLERQARVGRKLLATGNGRCNLSNAHAPGDHYHGQQPEFVGSAFARMNPEATLAWFRGMGLLTVEEASGRIYPYSDQANSVVDVLRFALNKPNIRVLTGCEVSRIRRKDGGFRVEYGEESLTCDRVIVACGGLAGTKLGGSMSGYKLLRAFGHGCTKLRPALVQLRSPWQGGKALKGVRANCRAEILKDGGHFSASAGEIQFTEYGLSGPVVFEISRDVCAGAGQWVCELDFLPQMTEEELLAVLKSRRVPNLPAEELLTGILHNRLGKVLLGAAGIRGRGFAEELSDRDLAEITRVVKAFSVPLDAPLGMDSAQVTAGGILTSEFDPDTMESRLVPGLYACGEVLDIDGDCGGYNLQWAWSSGYLAGRSAGKEIK